MTTDPDLGAVLRSYRPSGAREVADHQRVLAMAGTAPDPYDRSTPLHVTVSALVVDPPSERVLMRWHARQQTWLQVGGHADPGEVDPLAIALREAAEETGLKDLEFWPSPELLHLAVVSVRPGKGEPAHEHADLRYLLVTGTPDAVRPEDPEAELRWVTVPEAIELTASPSLPVFLERVGELFGGLR